MVILSWVLWPAFSIVATFYVVISIASLFGVCVTVIVLVKGSDRVEGFMYSLMPQVILHVILGPLAFSATILADQVAHIQPGMVLLLAIPAVLFAKTQEAALVAKWVGLPQLSSYSSVTPEPEESLQEAPSIATCTKAMIQADLQQWAGFPTFPFFASSTDYLRTFTHGVAAGLAYLTRASWDHSAGYTCSGGIWILGQIENDLQLWRVMLILLLASAMHEIAVCGIPLMVADGDFKSVAPSMIGFQGLATMLPKPADEQGRGMLVKFLVIMVVTVGDALPNLYVQVDLALAQEKTTLSTGVAVVISSLLVLKKSFEFLATLCRSGICDCDIAPSFEKYSVQWMNELCLRIVIYMCVATLLIIPVGVLTRVAAISAGVC